MKVALYATIFPSILPYVRPWYASVTRQQNADFTVHLGLDNVTLTDVAAATGAKLDAETTLAAAGDTPATVRQRSWERLVGRYDAVVLVDADDVLHPTRVAAAVQALASADVYACALNLIDESGRHLGKVFGGRPGADGSQELTLHNVFGLSNSAYRTRTLAEALPVPPDTVAVDWYLASRACLAGASLTFDDVPRMDYRQHGNNIGRVLAPFDAAYLSRATDVARRHHESLLMLQPPGTPPVPVLSSRRRAATVTAFAEAMRDAALRTTYLEAINRPARVVFAWWEIVAMPELETLWRH